MSLKVKRRKRNNKTKKGGEKGQKRKYRVAFPPGQGEPLPNNLEIVQSGDDVGDDVGDDEGDGDNMIWMSTDPNNNSNDLTEYFWVLERNIANNKYFLHKWSDNEPAVELPTYHIELTVDEYNDFKNRWQEQINNDPESITLDLFRWWSEKEETAEAANSLLDLAAGVGGSRRKNKTRRTFKNKTKKIRKRKFTDTSYPYRNVTKQQAINDFLKLKKLVKGDFNPKSLIGNMTVDYGTEKSRRKTKYRNLSFVDRWKNKTKRKKVIKFAKRLYSLHNPRSVFGSIISAINLQWGTVNTMRPAAAALMYKKAKAKTVLDFTAGWGARMIAAMALDIDYIGIDSNKSLKKGYMKIVKLLKPYTKSKVTLKFQKAETVDFKKLPKYDFVFTSPPYEYLEVYENMENYESKGKIKQPSSSNAIKMEDSDKFYKDFLIPTLEKSYKYLPKGKTICLNIPDMMYKKLKSKWKAASYTDTYEIVKRSGSNIGNKRRGKELIYCWKKK